MSEKSTPAGKNGGNTTTTISTALADLPARIRIHALAKLLGRNSREVLAAVTEAGVTGRSVQSSIDKEVALKVAESFGATATEPAAQPAAEAPAKASAQAARQIPPTPVFASAAPLFQPPQPAAAPPPPPPPPPPRRPAAEEVEDEDVADEVSDADEDGDDDSRPRRRRGRRGRGRGKGGQGDDGTDGDDRSDEDKGSDKDADKPGKADKDDKPSGKHEKSDRGGRRRGKPTAEESEESDDDAEDADDSDSASRRRRRRRRRKGGADDESSPTEDDPPNTVVHVREARGEKDDKNKGESDGRDEVRSVRGSTRLEAKRQRRRDGREAGRRRAPILSEAEFLARRESVDRAMVIRERGDRVQIGVLEDGVLVEHFVTSSGTGSLVGNVYLGRVQNVLPSMEAAFVDIGRGRNAVLYAGEVDWDAAGLEGKARKIEQALSTGDSVLVQVTKDPVGHKGARLTTQISLPGRFLVYVPGGGATGISRKLPENERRRLKDVLKRVVPEDAGVIIRTASEGISEDELGRDVRRLQAQWQVIQDKTQGANGTKKVGAPALVYEEPDLLVKVVRDLFTEDFSALVIEGSGAWETVDAYVRHVAPELADRVRKHVGKADVFAEYRIEEQLLKALDRKVWLPSGGYLVIDRTEAMTVIDVNTGKFTGSGGNLEETVTRNNLESAEEIVRQLRLRDIGGIIVIDFIDMVLESNRDLVLRRLTECLGRDRTRHQVAEVTSLGLVQMTRKRVGTGLLEAFGTTCEHCKGRGVLVSTEPMGKQSGSNGSGGSGGQQSGGRRSRGGRGDESKEAAAKEAAAKEAAKAVRDIAKATSKANGDTSADAPPSELAADSTSTAPDSSRAVTGSTGGVTESRSGAVESPGGSTAAAESTADSAAASADAAGSPDDSRTSAGSPSGAAESTADSPADSGDSATSAGSVQPDGAAASAGWSAPSTGWTSGGSAASAWPATADSAAYGVESPAASADAGSSPESPSEPASESGPELTAEPTAEPTARSAAEPTSGFGTESAAQSTADSAAEFGAETRGGSAVEPVAGFDAQQTAGFGTQPAAWSAAEPTDSAVQPVADSGAEAGVGSTAERMTGSAAWSPAGSDPEPTVEPAADPAYGSAVEPIAESAAESATEPDVESRRGRFTGRIRRRASRSAGEPSTTITPPAEQAVSTAPAGTDSFIRSGDHNGGGVPEQADGGAHEAPEQAEQDGSAASESSVEAVTSPPRRPVRRGASRPAGPPVSATHDG